MLTILLLVGGLNSAAGLPPTVAAPPQTPAEISAAIERARTSAPVSVGVAVHDEAGGAVGTVSTVEGTMLTLVTGHHKVKLPVSAVTRQGSTYLINATAAQLDSIMSGVNRPKSAAVKN